MIVLDASVLIAHVEPDDAHHARATQLLLSVDDALFASPITLADFYVGPARAGVLDRAEQVVGDLGLTAVALPPDGSRRLAILRARTRLKTPDYCVLLAAQQTGAAVASFDDPVRSHATALGMRVLPDAE